MICGASFQVFLHVRLQSSFVILPGEIRAIADLPQAGILGMSLHSEEPAVLRVGID